jgi:hypothetical protein
VADRLGEGVGPTNFVQVDPDLGMVYTASRYGNEVTAFGEANATFVRLANLQASGLIQTFDLDTTHHILWLGIQPEKAYYGYTGDTFLWGLDEYSFTLITNLTLYPGSSHPFAPDHSLFVPETEKLYLQNGTGALAVVNTSTLTVAPVIPDPIPNTYGTGLAFYSNGSNSFLVAGSGQGGWYAVSPVNDTRIGTYPFSSTVYLGGPAADPYNGCVWFRNASADGLVKFDPNGSFRASYPLNTSTYGLTAFPSFNTLVFSSYVGSSGAVVIAVNAANLQVVGWRPTGSEPSGYAFDPVTESVVTSGYDNGSMMNLQLYNLSVLHRYSAFPTYRGSTTVDSVRGTYFLGQLDPASITAYNESNGSLIWRTSGGWIANATGFAQDVDPRAGVLYSTSEGFQVQLLEFSETTGTFLGNLSLANNAYSSGLWIDQAHRILYAGYVGAGNPGVIVYNLTTAAVMRNIALPPWFALCGGAANPATTSLYVQSCGGANNVSEISGVNFTRFASHDLPAGRNFPTYATRDIAVNATGFGFVPLSGGMTENLSILSPGTPGRDQLLALPDWRNANSVAVDDAQRLLYVDSSGFEGADPIGVYDESTLVHLGDLTQPIATTNLALDIATSTLISPLVWSSQVVTFRQIPVPAAPSNLTLAPSNASLSAQWTPSPGAEGFAIDGYNVSISSNLGATWTTGAQVTGSTALLSGLTDGDSYVVRVEAYGVGGTSPWSTTTSATPVGVPYPPISLSLAGAGSSGLFVTWKAPTLTGGLPILNYTVQFRPVSGSWTAVSAGTVLHANLSGLDPGTEYEVRVLAWNQVGNSSPSAAARLVAGASAWNPLAGLGGYVVAAILLLILAAVAAFLLLRRRHPPSPVPPTSFLPGPSPPPGAGQPPPPPGPPAGPP